MGAQRGREGEREGEKGPTRAWPSLYIPQVLEFKSRDRVISNRKGAQRNLEGKEFIITRVKSGGRSEGS